MVDLLFLFGLLCLWLKDVSIGILSEEKLILERSGDLQIPIPVCRKLFLFSESETSFCTSESSVGFSASLSLGELLVGSVGTGSPLKLTGESSEIGTSEDA